MNARSPTLAPVMVGLKPSFKIGQGYFRAGRRATCEWRSLRLQRSGYGNKRGDASKLPDSGLHQYEQSESSGKPRHGILGGKIVVDAFLQGAHTINRNVWRHFRFNFSYSILQSFGFCRGPYLESDVSTLRGGVDRQLELVSNARILHVACDTNYFLRLVILHDVQAHGVSIVQIFCRECA